MGHVTVRRDPSFCRLSTDVVSVAKDSVETTLTTLLSFHVVASLAGQTFEEGRERLVTVVDFPCAITECCDLINQPGTR